MKFGEGTKTTPSLNSLIQSNYVYSKPSFNFVDGTAIATAALSNMRIPEVEAVSQETAKKIGVITIALHLTNHCNSKCRKM